MNKEMIKKSFLEELKFFSLIAKRDLEKGFTIEQVEDELIKMTSSFYGSRLDYDEFAMQKGYFIATYAYQIIKGNFDDEYLEEFYEDICENIKK